MSSALCTLTGKLGQNISKMEFLPEGLFTKQSRTNLIHGKNIIFRDKHASRS